MCSFDLDSILTCSTCDVVTYEAMNGTETFPLSCIVCGGRSQYFMQYELRWYATVTVATLSEHLQFTDWLHFVDCYHCIIVCGCVWR